MTIGPAHYAILGSLVFIIGLAGVCVRRHPLAVLMSLCVMFLGPVLALAGFAALGGGEEAPAGDAVALITLLVMSAQVMCGAGLTLVLWRRGRLDDIGALRDGQD